MRVRSGGVSVSFLAQRREGGADSARSHRREAALAGRGGPVEAGHGVTRRAVGPERTPGRPRSPRNLGERRGKKRARREKRASPAAAAAASAARDPDGHARAEREGCGRGVAQAAAFLEGFVQRVHGREGDCRLAHNARVRLRGYRREIHRGFIDTRSRGTRRRDRGRCVGREGGTRVGTR